MYYSTKITIFAIIKPRSHMKPAGLSKFVDDIKDIVRKYRTEAAELYKQKKCLTNFNA